MTIKRHIWVLDFNKDMFDVSKPNSSNEINCNVRINSYPISRKYSNFYNSQKHDNINELWKIGHSDLEVI